VSVRAIRSTRSASSSTSPSATLLVGFEPRTSVSTSDRTPWAGAEILISVELEGFGEDGPFYNVLSIMTSHNGWPNWSVQPSKGLDRADRRYDSAGSGTRSRAL
jgi:hypothetical protein